MYILGIDIGSSFLKASVLDLENNKTKESRIAPTPGFLEKNTVKKEISMEKLTLEVKRIIEFFQEKYRLSGIVFSTQMHGFMLFDRAGNARGNYVTWQDRRCTCKNAAGKTTLDILDALLERKGFYQKGADLKPNYSLCALRHYVENEELADDKSGPLEYAMLGDGLIRMLTGERVPVHPTIAASSGMYDVRQKNWNYELLAAAHLDFLSFPLIGETSRPVAEYDSREGKIPLYLALGDHQCAVLGSGASDGDVVINIGTGGQISYVDKGLRFGSYEVRPFFEGRTLRTIAQLPSGRSLNVLIQLIKNITDNLAPDAGVDEAAIWKAIDKLHAGNGAEKAKGMPEVDFSFFDGAGGSISGITDTNLTLGGLFAGAYASMAENYYSDCQKILCDGARVKRVILTGGVARKTPFLQELMKDRFEVPCMPAPCADDVMTGLLRYARWCEEGKALFG